MPLHKDRRRTPLLCAQQKLFQQLGIVYSARVTTALIAKEAGLPRLAAELILQLDNLECQLRDNYKAFRATQTPVRKPKKVKADETL